MRDLEAVFSTCFRNASSQSPSVLGSLAWRFQALHLVVVSLSPFLALRRHVFLCVLKSREGPFALHEVAGPTGGHKVIQFPRAAMRIGVNMVDRQDQPVFETLLSIQPAVLALEMVPLENLHCQLKGNIGPGPKISLLIFFRGMIPPSRRLDEQSGTDASHPLPMLAVSDTNVYTCETNNSSASTEVHGDRGRNERHAIFGGHPANLD